MKVNQLGYRQWQKRNTDAFRALSKQKQKAARQLGYRNVGWIDVQASWEILERIQTPSLFDAKLKRGDVLGAIDQSILEADQAKEIAQDSIVTLRKKRQRSQKKTQATLKKYQLL